MPLCKNTWPVRFVGVDPANRVSFSTVTILSLAAGELMYEQISLPSANAVIDTYTKALRSAMTDDDLRRSHQAIAFWRSLNRTNSTTTKP